MPECSDCPALAANARGAGIRSGWKDNAPQCAPQEYCVPEQCVGQCSPLPECYKQPKIPDSYKPKLCYMPPVYPVQNTTTYNMSFLPTCDPCGARGQMRKPMPNLVPSTALMENCTTNRMSYCPNPCVITNPIRPCNHDMWGRGPMQAVTTQRHDYVPKPTRVRQSMKPPAKFHCVEAQFENKTTNRLSYLDPGVLPITNSYRPIRMYEKPIIPGDYNTTQRMSYQAQCIRPPERLPWACKGEYQKPCGPLECTTIYNASFIPPGCCVTECCICKYGPCRPSDCTVPSKCVPPSGTSPYPTAAVG